MQEVSKVKKENFKLNTALKSNLLDHSQFIYTYQAKQHWRAYWKNQALH